MVREGLALSAGERSMAASAQVQGSREGGAQLKEETDRESEAPEDVHAGARAAKTHWPREVRLDETGPCMACRPF